ncbi:Uncharacterised protein [Segatella copri]|nr:Uncharacterised protein [Segatella copri]
MNGEKFWGYFMTRVRNHMLFSSILKKRVDMSLILKFVVIITMHLLVEFWHENFMVNLQIFSSLIK